MNGRAIYCVTAKRLPGVGAASPDRNTCHAACVRYYKCTFCPGVDTKRQPKKTGRAARKVNQVRLDYSLIHKSIPQRRPSSLTAASFKYGQKCRKCSGRNVMNPDGFKKFKHDCPCCRLCFRQNLSVCIQHHASRIPRHAGGNRKRRKQAGVAHHH